MTALHFTSVSYIPTIIRIFNCWFKFICLFPSANYDHIRGNFEVSKSCWIIMGSQSSDVPAISNTDPALVITGSSNLCLMIVKLQRSLPWAKPSVHIWLTMVWFHFIKKLLLNRQKGHLIFPSRSMRVLIVHFRKNKWIVSLDFGMIPNVK